MAISKNKTIIKAITVNEFLSFKAYENNRCCAFSVDEAREKGFSESEYNAYRTRVKSIKNTLESIGYWEPGCIVQIGKIIGDPNWYILDGQGRWGALKLMNTDSEFLKNVDENGGIVCQVFTEPMTKEEMSDRIRVINSGHHDWGKEDIVHQYVKSVGGDALNKFNKIADWKDKYGIKNAYGPNIIWFGKTQYDSVKKDITKCESFRPNHEIIVSSFERIFEASALNRTYQNKRLATGSNVINILESLYGAIATYYTDDVMSMKDACDKMTTAIVKKIIGFKSDYDYELFFRTMNDKKFGKAQFYTKYIKNIKMPIDMTNDSVLVNWSIGNKPKTKKTYRKAE